MLNLVVGPAWRWLDCGRELVENILLADFFDIRVTWKCASLQFFTETLPQSIGIGHQPGFHALDHQKDIFTRVGRDLCEIQLGLQVLGWIRRNNRRVRVHQQDDNAIGTVFTKSVGVIADCLIGRAAWRNFERVKA